MSDVPPTASDVPPAPSASIVIPTVGRLEYLEVALASVAPQAKALGAEMVVVNDGGDPRTTATASRHQARIVSLPVAEISRHTRGATIVYRDGLGPLVKDGKLPASLGYSIISRRRGGEKSPLSNIAVLAPAVPPGSPVILAVTPEEGRICLEWLPPGADMLARPVELGGFFIIAKIYISFVSGFVAEELVVVGLIGTDGDVERRVKIHPGEVALVVVVGEKSIGTLVDQQVDRPPAVHESVARGDVGAVLDAGEVAQVDIFSRSDRDTAQSAAQSNTN